MESYNGFKDRMYSTIIIFILLFIAIQVGAFVCWNNHYNWFKIQVKSCWGDKDDEGLPSYPNVEDEKK
jgi:hypothetical protein